jgi:hypothetical protein
LRISRTLVFMSSAHSFPVSGFTQEGHGLYHQIYIWA